MDLADNYRPPPILGGIFIRITKEQGEFIRENYQGMTAKAIGEKIGLTARQVIGWANHNDVHKGRSRLFHDHELEFIEQNYLTMTYQEIADILGYTERQICGWINNNLQNKIRTFNNHYFDVITTPNQAYWLGFIYADGWISSHRRNQVGTGHSSGRNCGVSMCYEFGIELQREDEYLLEAFNQEIGGVHKIYQKHKQLRICNNRSITETDTSVIRVYSNPFVEGLINNGIDFNKTRSDKFPIVGDDLFPDFLRGYIDGDGCIHEMRPGVLAVHITGANIKALQHIQERLLELYGIHTSIYTENKMKHRLYCFRKKDVKHLLDIIYYNPDSIKLTRKYNKYLNFYGLAA